MFELINLCTKFEPLLFVIIVFLCAILLILIMLTLQLNRVQDDVRFLKLMSHKCADLEVVKIKLSEHQINLLKEIQKNTI